MSDLRDFTGKNRKHTGTTGITVSDNGSGTSGRVAEKGRLRFNDDNDIMEYYNGTSWIGIDAPPSVTGVTPSTIPGGDDPFTIVISGSNFSTSGLTVRFFSNNGTEITPDTVTRNSSAQITVQTSKSSILVSSAIDEPYDVKVTNGSGLSATLEDAFSINESPAWSTASGALAAANTGESYSVTLAATDPEGGDVDYNLNGVLPGGLSLASETGVISGTVSGGSYNSSGIVYNFSVDAYDTSSNATTRSFSITQQWKDGSTSAQASTLYNIEQNALNVIGSNGQYADLYLQYPQHAQSFTSVFQTKVIRENNKLFALAATFQTEPGNDPHTSKKAWEWQYSPNDLDQSSWDRDNYFKNSTTNPTGAGAYTWATIGQNDTIKTPMWDVPTDDLRVAWGGSGLGLGSDGSMHYDWESGQANKSFAQVINDHGVFSDPAPQAGGSVANGHGSRLVASTISGGTVSQSGMNYWWIGGTDTENETQLTADFAMLHWSTVNTIGTFNTGTWPPTFAVGGKRAPWSLTTGFGTYTNGYYNATNSTAGAAYPGDQSHSAFWAYPTTGLGGGQLVGHGHFSIWVRADV
tara:strand:+ start:425 stop:2161 length:1737 start_codon:yes stop_codon:yes gene_type:complete